MPLTNLKKPLLEFSPWQRLSDMVANKTVTAGELSERRAAVQELLLRSSSHILVPNFQGISNQDLGTLFQAIDEMFFEGCVTPVCERSSHRPLSFRLSTRMISTGGTTTMRTRRGLKPQRHFEIAIATTPLFETFRIDNETLVGGLVCHSRLDALQRIMEHEMVHLVEMLLWENSNCSAGRYKSIIQRFFGHTESKHRMLTPRDVAQQRNGIRLGDPVVFEVNGQRLSGTVNRISKRATVLVPASATRGIRFNDGNFYVKYYVPLNRLRPAG
jgi:hypothetical protein